MRTFLVLSFFTILSTFQLFAQTDDYIWPTDASPYLSSTFGETRSAHFHSGLDIKTWGREGYRVFASKDGYLSRMSISSQGYGRVLYLIHDDGSVTVYAHLQRFIPELQNYIDSIRLITHTFEIDVNLPKNKWVFEQGDIIGYTGSTGVGPPHLHFEIRDGNDVAINALQTNLSIEDTIAPRITSMLILPMSDSTTIKGSKYPRISYPETNPDGTLNFGEITADGPIGITISEYDGANNVTNKYASYKFSLSHKEDTIFSSTHRSFHFDEAKTMPLDRIPAYSSSRRSYQTLFSDSRVNVPFYNTKWGNGVIVPDSLTREYRLTVSDIYGNETIARFEVQKGTKTPSVIVQDAPEIGNWYWRNDWVVQHSSSTLNLKEPDFGVPWDQASDQQLLYYNGHEILFYRINPDSSHTFWTPDRNVKLHIPSGSTFDEMSVAVFTSRFQRFPSLQVQPYSAPLRNKIHIQYYVDQIDTLGSNPQLFHFDPIRERFSHVSSRLIGNTIHAQTNALGEFIVFSDATPPSINGVELVQKEWGDWQVEVSVSDEYSGIDFKRSEIRVNGIRGITEYDFEEDLLIYILPNFEPEKRNRIEVIVSDNAGNSDYQTFIK
ncbi:MAG: M23 family metallopeptidase [Balneolaceae bacterium]|nr:M23 family metallopeptidase [Balneolaceae bacterium]